MAIKAHAKAHTHISSGYNLRPPCYHVCHPVKRTWIGDPDETDTEVAGGPFGPDPYFTRKKMMLRFITSLDAFIIL